VAEHRWKFARVGGFDQVEIKTGADLVRLGSLDQKLWVALACPTKGLEFDARTLELLDADKDGRIRASELIAAVEWAGKMVEDVETLAKGSASIAIDAINGSSDEGKLLRKTAKAVLESLGRADAKEIGVADMTDALGAFHKQSFNGDGIVPAESATDPDTKKVLEDILACTTAQTDKSGKPGVTRETTDAFFDAIAAHAEWVAKGAADESTRVLGDATSDAHAAFVAVRAKIDDYFARCRIAAFDPRAITAVNRDEAEYLSLGAKEFDRSASDLSAFPIAQVAPEKPLPLAAGVNPAWADAVGSFATKVVVPLLGAKSAITASEWSTIRERFEGYEKWLSAKQGASVEKLGAARVKALAASDAKTKVLALLEQEHAAEPLAKAIESVERLVRYNRDLMNLANNFVSFRDFYSRARPATFQIGTLYVDTRACDLCVRVNDAARHATMAPRANTCMVYCECKNSKGETMTIAAAMTAGDVDNLMVGRNGVFYDRKGVDWDATITSIVDNPISIRQAFWSPYKKALRVIEETIARRAATAAAASDARVSGHAQTATDAVTGIAVDPHAAAAAAATPATAPAARPAATGPKPFDLGTIAAIGVAVGGISAAFGALLAAFFGLGRWMPVGVIGLLLAISGPSMAIAWLKLRKRNLGPILDANGWAVNAQAMINVPLGGSLTKLATLPPGSSRNLVDPYAEKSPPWGVYATGAAVAALAVFWYLGRFDGMLPAAARASRFHGVTSPASARPAVSPAPVARAGAASTP
jgi:hypothetical protein